MTRILDKKGNELENPDLELGYLVDETIVIAHHEAIESEPEKYVRELVWKDPNDPNNKLYKKKLVKAAVPYQPAWDETEEIKRYITYTKKELAERQKEKELKEQQAAEEAERQAEQDKINNARLVFVDDGPEALAEIATMTANNTNEIQDIKEALVELAILMTAEQGE